MSLVTEQYRESKNGIKFHQRIKTAKKDLLDLLIDEEKHILDEYHVAMISNSPPLGDAAQAKNLNCILAVCRLYGKRSWKKATEKDLRLLVTKIMRKYSEDGSRETNTTYDCKKYLKIWYRFIRLGNRSFSQVGDPDESRWLKPTTVKPKISREQLLNDEDIELMVSNCKTFQERAMILLDYEAGARIGEVLSLKIKHIKHEKNWIKIMVDGKTGDRGIRLLKSRNALLDWLNVHPYVQDPEAPLWVKEVGKNKGQPMTYDAARNRLQSIMRKCGWIVYQEDPLTGKKRKIVKRRVYFHLFRHSSATQSAAIYSETILRKMYGWSMSSKMVARYTHIVDKDVDDAIAKTHGLKVETTKDNIPKICSRCKTAYDFGGKFCSNCGNPVKKTAIQVDYESENKLENLEKQLAYLKEHAVDEILQQFQENPEKLLDSLEKSGRFKPA